MIVRWIKQLGVWGWISVAVGGFALAAVVAAGSIYWQRNRIETMLARIREVGEPVTEPELHAMLPALSPARDSTRLWLDGFAVNGPTDQARFGKLPFVGFAETDEPPASRSAPRVRFVKGPFPDVEKRVVPPVPGSDWPELALAEAYLADRAEALKRFHAAAESGDPARLYPMRDPFSFDFQSPRDAAHALLLESQIHAHKGEIGPTVAALQAAFAVGKICEGIPNHTSFLARQGIDAKTTEQLLRLLPHVPFSDSQLAQFQSTLRAIDYRKEHLHSLLGERVAGIRILKDPGLLFGPFLSVFERFEFTMIADRAMPHYLDRMSEVIAASTLPWPEALATARRIKLAQEPPPPSARFQVEITPATSIKSVFQAAARGTARIRLADIALAAQRYRLANGRLPQSIEDLVPTFLPSIPLDPFDGKPLHFVPTDDGFVVYSVGSDRTDDGGRLEEFQSQRPDLGYRIRYPKDAGEASTE